MTYINPQDVISPKHSVANVRVIYNGGEWDSADPKWTGWAVCELDWEAKPSVGLRWNGTDGEPGVGNPQSRGLPTWLIVPEPLADVVLARVVAHRDGTVQDEVPVSPKRRLLDLISYVRSATDEELSSMIDQMGLWDFNPQTHREQRSR